MMSIDSPIRLTVDEISAVARLRALIPPPYVPTDAERLSESGTRSLLARGLLGFSPDGPGLTMPKPIQELVELLGSCSRFLVLARNDGQEPTRSGRVLLPAGGSTVIEEESYPGVFGFTPIDRDKLSDFLFAVFDLAREPGSDSESSGEGRTGNSMRLVHSGGEVRRPVFPDEWCDPVLNTVMLVDAEAGEGSVVAWVAEGSNVWRLDLGAEPPASAQEAGEEIDVAASTTTGTELADELRDFVARFA